MLVRLSSSSLKEGRWYEYVTRFVLGGAATVFAGVMSSAFGASIGGLFLAMPAIFCASTTLIERHEIRRKHEAGLSGTRRGQQAAALEAAGATLGSIGLLAFALVFWRSAEENMLLAFVGAAVAWSTASIAAWWIYKRSPWRRRLS
jgi:hypothetical protein